MWSAFYLTAKCALIITVVGCLVCQVFPYQITRLFVAGDTPLDRQMIEITIDGFHKNMSVFWMVGFAIIGTNFFASMGQPKKALFLSLTRQVIFLIPILLILPRFIGTDGVWFAAPIADVLATLSTVILVYRERRLQNRTLIKD